MRIFGKKVRIGKSKNPYEQAQHAEAQRRLASIKLSEAQKKEEARQANIQRRHLSPPYRFTQGTGRVASTTGRGIISFAKGVKSFANNQPVTKTQAQQPSRQRAVYVSTSHGLKRIKPDDPRYAQAASQNTAPPIQRVRVKDFDDEQPSAFRGL